MTIRQFYRQTRFVSSAVLISLLLPVFVLSPPGAALATDLKTEMTKQQQQLRQVQELKQTTMEELQTLERQLEDITSQVAAYEKQLQASSEEIKKHQAELQKLQASAPRSKQQLIDRLTAYYTFSDIDLLTVLFSAVSVDDLLTLESAMDFIISYDTGLMSSYVELMNDIKLQQAVLDVEAKIAQRTRQDLLDANAELSAVISRKSILLLRLNSQENVYRESIADLLESEQQSAVIKNARPEQQALRDGLENTSTTGIHDFNNNYTTQFAKAIGSLPLPAAGAVQLDFDTTASTPKAAGLKIYSSEAEDVRAVHAGLVTHVGFREGYGSLVEIDHGDGYQSLYAGLSTYHVRVGDVLTARAKIGQMASRKDIADTTLYVELRHQGTPLNPKLWFKELR